MHNCSNEFILKRAATINDFAHIPYENTPNFPKPPQRKKFRGIFQGYVGEILENFTCVTLVAETIGNPSTIPPKNYHILPEIGKMNCWTGTVKKYQGIIGWPSFCWKLQLQPMRPQKGIKSRRFCLAVWWTLQKRIPPLLNLPEKICF